MTVRGRTAEALIDAVDAVRAEIQQMLSAHPTIVEALQRQAETLAELRALVRSKPEDRQAYSSIESLLEAIAVAATAKTERSLETALEGLMHLTHAQRGFIVLRSSTGALSFPAARSFAANGVGEPEAHISSSILRAALSGQTSVVVVDALDDERFGGSDSVRALALRAVLAIPLQTDDQTWGAVYLDNPMRAGAFADDARIAAERFARIIGPIIERDLALDESEREHSARTQRIRDNHAFDGTIGESDVLLNLLELVSRVAPTDAAVLVTGEAGTGKEAIARAIHDCSRRASKRFVTINCGAYPGEMIEPELFGYEPGAVTGTRADRAGRLAAAHGGTLFIDEVSMLSPTAQAKLLRVLTERSYQRVGSSTPRSADVRVIAASHRSLADEVAAGRFRSDLLYRLAVIPLHLPPLREREGDVPLLAMHFLRFFARVHGRKVRSISPLTLAALEAHSWPGNVRELSNVMERAVILTREEELTRDSLSLVTTGADKPVEPGTLRGALRAYKRRLVERALAVSSGDNAAASRMLGVHPKYLYQLLRELELSSSSRSTPPPPSATRGERSKRSTLTPPIRK